MARFSEHATMRNDDLLILRGIEVHTLLAGRELELIHIIRTAYIAHRQGDSSLPHSTFLSFPGEQVNRIIALPAYIGKEFGVAGIKWIASFPGNLDKGIDRASAVVILNSPLTGRPEAILEGSIISAKRTAASAALAAQCLLNANRLNCVGMIGCGLINFEIARFLLTVFPNINALVVYDKEINRANHFKIKCKQTIFGIEVDIAKNVETVLRGSSLVSIATTAVNPHISALSECSPGSTILHISLRDLSPEVILACDNVVDDIDHVCRAQTSVHLAEQQIGNRDFIRCNLADILTSAAPARKAADSIVVFSPFGLGILDIAVSKFVCNLALHHNQGEVIKSFLPISWVENNERRIQ